MGPNDDWIWDSARREVIEETSVELLPEPGPLLASMDVHGIPSNGREPYHLHHDLLFAFRAASDAIRRSPESKQVAWCSPADFDRYALPDNVRRAYHRIQLSSIP